MGMESKNRHVEMFETEKLLHFKGNKKNEATTTRNWEKILANNTSYGQLKSKKMLKNSIFNSKTKTVNERAANALRWLFPKEDK